MSNLGEFKLQSGSGCPEGARGGKWARRLIPEGVAGSGRVHPTSLKRRRTYREVVADESVPMVPSGLGALTGFLGRIFTR